MSKEQTKDLATKNSQSLLSPEEQKALETLNANSGAKTSSFTFIPEITIDNSMAEAKLEDGRSTFVRCKPQFVINESEEKEEDGKKVYKYKKIPFIDTFEGVILAVRHQTRRKYLADQNGKCLNTIVNFRSLEFKSFNSDVYIWQDGKFLSPMSYKEAKLFAAGGIENELWMTAYILINGEKTARKFAFKGASRSVLFDYMSIGGKSSVITKFSLILDKEKANPYNKLVLKDTGKKPNDIMAALKAQKEINDILDKNSMPSEEINEEKAEIVNNNNINEDVIDIPDNAF